jgi:hypothetical protein
MRRIKSRFGQKLSRLIAFDSCGACSNANVSLNRRMAACATSQLGLDVIGPISREKSEEGELFFSKHIDPNKNIKSFKKIPAGKIFPPFVGLDDFRPLKGGKGLFIPLARNQEKHCKNEEVPVRFYQRPSSFLILTLTLFLPSHLLWSIKERAREISTSRESTRKARVAPTETVTRTS